jgi:hypothetical protein
MNDDKNIGELNNSFFSKQWVKQYWIHLFSLSLNFIVFSYVVFQAISEYLNHQPYYKILQFAGIAIQSVGIAVSSFGDLIEKEQPQKSARMSNINLLLQFLGFSLYILSAFRGAYPPDLVIHWTFYPWKNQ